MSSKHKIERQVLDLQLTENEGVYELQSRFRDLYYQQLLPAIEAELNEVSSNEDVVVIDQLELDLGELENLDQIDSELIQKCIQQIREQLTVVRSYGSTNKTEGDVVSDANIRIEGRKENLDITYFKALVFFLENGYLPWKIVSNFSENHEESRVKRLIVHIIQHEPQKFYSYVRRNASRTKVQLRLYNHLTTEQIEQIVQHEKVMNFTLSRVEVNELLEEISAVVTNQPLRDQSKKAILWAVYVLFTTTGITENVTHRSVLPTLVELVIREQKLSINFWEFVLNVAQKYFSLSIPALKKQLNKIGLTEQLIETISDILKEKPLVSPKSSREKAVAINEWIIKKKNILVIQNVIPLIKGDLEELFTQYAKQVVSKKDSVEIEDYVNTEKDEELVHEEQERLTIPEEGISVENGGLVILWPYLTTLFDHLEWLDQEGNILEEALPKALSLTHYLIFGHEEEDESLLILNKLLLGIDLEDPMTNSYRLTDIEKEEADGLIQAVINNWSAIGNVSVDGFRGSFLVRPGIIYDREEMYHLIVERKAFDILMDQLPWSISIVRLRWMEKLLSVTW